MNHTKIMPSLRPKTSRSIGKSDNKLQSAKTKSVIKKKFVLKTKPQTLEKAIFEKIKQTQIQTQTLKENLKEISPIEEIIQNKVDSHQNKEKEVNNEVNEEVSNEEVSNEEVNENNEESNDEISNEYNNEENNDEISNEEVDDNKPTSQRSKRRNKNYGRETRYNKKKIEFEFGVGNDDEITGQQETLMVPLTKFFKENNNIERILPILKGQSPISLRIIDWFVTNYSKEMGTVYDINEYSKKENENGESKSVVSGFDSLFFVHFDYRCQLKSFYKKKFDPFCRKTKIQFYYQPDKYIITTVGQLNFFRWAIKNYVLNFIEDNLEAIEEHMNDNIKISKVNEFNKPSSPKNQNQISGQTKRRKRKEISPSAMKSITKYNSPVTVTFN